MFESIKEQNNISERLMPLTRMLRRKEVLHLTGIGQTHMYYLIGQGEFPRAVPLGGKIVGWVDTEVQAWIEARIDERNRKQ